MCDDNVVSFISLNLRNFTVLVLLHFYPGLNLILPWINSCAYIRTPKNWYLSTYLTHLEQLFPYHFDIIVYGSRWHQYIFIYIYDYESSLPPTLSLYAYYLYPSAIEVCTHRRGDEATEPHHSGHTVHLAYVRIESL